MKSFSFSLDNSFQKELPGDPSTTNVPRQVTAACYSNVLPLVPSVPKLLAFSTEAGALIGISQEEAHAEAFTALVSGKEVYPETQPYAMNYGGHQFGSWAGQLGDGRAINLFELLHQGQRWMIQLKGAGPTPYSRRGDGLAVLRSSIREFLCSEAMHHLGVPTTRALSLVQTGDQVLRDILYNGNSAYEPGAIVCRIAPTFLRFGNYQLFAARGEFAVLQQLVDYTIRHFFPTLGPPSKETYARFFQEVSERTLELVLQWQRVGFVHGVMNTDNMSILGLTIDYGPYGWLDNYDPDWTPNTTDLPNKRYRFGHQAQVAQWNLLQLANALYPLVEQEEPFIEALNHFSKTYEQRYLEMMGHKLGFASAQLGDEELVKSLDYLLCSTETDMTLFFRLLSRVHPGKEKGLQELFPAFYQPEEVVGGLLERWERWVVQYQQRTMQEVSSPEERVAFMHRVNPKYVLRNYMAQLAIEAAERGEYTLLYELQTLLKAPYEEQPTLEKWFDKRPDWARTKTGCSALSCSS